VIEITYSYRKKGETKIKMNDFRKKKLIQNHPSSTSEGKKELKKKVKFPSLKK